ncbi:MAG: hypothetical protein QOD40_2181 [Alphaproteobacteria bacterium]|nr:hypothetical protein [Alphaproteobacteria bacterium]
MRNTFLTTTAAAALLAGAQLASVQAIAQAPEQQKAAPAEINKSKSDAKSDEKSMDKSQSKDQSSAQKPAQNAQATGSKTETTGQAAPQAAPAAKDTKAQDTTKTDTKAQDAQKQDVSKPQNAQSGSATQNAQTPSSSNSAQGQTGSGTSSASSTTSSGAAGANVTLNTEQKTKIRETVIKQSGAPRVANVNFSLSIGTAVPKTVKLARVPSTIIEIQPAWREYEYFLVGDQIVIVDPRNMHIVAVLAV